MITDARESKFIQLHRVIPTIPENDENSPLNDQNDSISINSTKSVKLADSKSKDACSIKSNAFLESKLVDSKLKIIDITSLNGLAEAKEDDISTKLSCLTDLEAASAIGEPLAAVSSLEDLDNDFSEVECGEPSVTRHLTIDFTISQDDTDFVQQKCSDFWNFINSYPNLKHMMVIPDPDKEKKKETQLEDVDENVFTNTASPSTPPATAIDALHKHDGIVPQAFTAKQPVICRDQDDPTYCHGSCNRLDKQMMKKLKKEKAAQAKSKKQLASIATRPHRSSSSFLTNLCSELDAWDQQHPKSFEPPTLVRMDLASCSPEASAEPLTVSLMSPKEPVCTSDMMCVPCTPSVEDILKVDQLELVVRAEE